MAYAGPIARLIQQLARLPGIGEKTAARLAFHLLRSSSEEVAALAAAIAEVKEKIRFCGICCDLTERDPCLICTDARRDPRLICVVAQPQDVIAIERAGGYHGRYHVLHGILSPLDGIGPEDVRVAELLRRCAERASSGTAASPAGGGAPAVEEIILATSPSIEGEATAIYIAKLTRPLGLRTTRIATGVPIGGELEYADHLTLSRAIDGRREI